jgi:hypothetical protein
VNKFVSKNKRTRDKKGGTYRNKLKTIRYVSPDIRAGSAM